MATPVGCGAWAMGGPDRDYAGSSQSDTDSIAAVLKAIELGMDWADRTAVSGRGHSEDKVRWLGISNFDVEQIERVQSIAPPWKFFEPQVRVMG